MSESNLIEEKARHSFASGAWPLMAITAALLGLVAFLLLPGSIATKTHLALHGICAQRPSHSLYLDGAALPLDARMTGMYISAAATICWLIAAGRMRATKSPPLSVLAVLAGFVDRYWPPMAFNALAVDLGLPHPYEPSNVARLVTGILAGTAWDWADRTLDHVGVGGRGSAARDGDEAARAADRRSAYPPRSARWHYRACRSCTRRLPFGLLLAAIVVFAAVGTIAGGAADGSRLVLPIVSRPGASGR